MAPFSLLSASGDNLNLVGPSFMTNTYFGYGAILNTVSIQISNFIGNLYIEGTIEPNPQSTDWVPVISQTYSVMTTQTTGQTFSGNFLFLRARLDRSNLPNPSPTTVSAAYGVVDQIILDSSSNVFPPSSGGGSGGTTIGAINEGTGTNVFDTISGNNMVFRSITGANGLTISTDTTNQTIILSAPAPTYTGIDLKSNANDVGTVETINFTGAATVTKVGSVATVSVSSGDPSDYVILKYSGGASGDLSSVDSIQSSSANVTATIIDGPNCIVEFTFTTRPNPPSSIAIMGQNYSTNTFSYQNVNPNISTRSMTFGGSADSPNIFGGFQALTIQLRMSDTSSSAPFGSRAVAAIYFKF